MRTRTQNGVTGTDDLAGYAQGQQKRTHDELQFFDSTTVNVEQTTRGIRLHAKIPIPPAAQPEPVSGATRYRVKSCQGDYVTCRTWDGTTEGSEDVKVAKPPELRWSKNGDMIEGVWIAYYPYQARTDNLDGERIATGGSVIQTEIVIPVFQTDCEIWADKPTGGTGAIDDAGALEWLDTNRAARAWCRVPLII